MRSRSHCSQNEKWKLFLPQNFCIAGRTTLTTTSKRNLRSIYHRSVAISPYTNLIRSGVTDIELADNATARLHATA